MSDDNRTHTAGNGDDRPDDPGARDRADRPRPARRLTRRDDERLVAGVAAGFAAYFDIDPVIARLVFVGLGLYGGLGVVIYLVCWAVMPLEGGDRGDDAGRDRPSVTRIVGITVLVLAALAIFNVIVGTAWRGGWRGWGAWPVPGPAPWWPGTFAPLRPGILLAVVLVVAGIALYQLGRPGPGGGRDDGPAQGAQPAGRSGPAPSGGIPARGPGETTPADPAASAQQQPPASSTGPTDGPTAPLARWAPDHEAAARQSGPLAPAAPSPSAPLGSAPATSPPSAAPATPTPPPRPPSPLGRLTLAVALLAVGAIALLGQTTVLNPRLADLAAVALIVVGLGLVVGAWWGRARWLIAVGFALLPIVLVALLLPRPPWYDGLVFPAGTAGEQHYRPASVEDLRDSYALATGVLYLDLQDLELEPGSERTVSVDVAAGQIHVVLPPEADVLIDARAMVGSVELPGWQAGGLLVSERRSDDVGGTARLDLDVSVRAGEIVVRRPPGAQLPDAGPPTGTRAALARSGTGWPPTRPGSLPAQGAWDAAASEGADGRRAAVIEVARSTASSATAGGVR